MSIVIVPEHVDVAIKAALERELALLPEARVAYKKLYNSVLNHYNEHGAIPDFTIRDIKSDAQLDRAS